MAIDTHDKRRSTWGMVPFLTKPPVPDGTISQTDRAHIGGHYRGIAVQIIEVIQGAIKFILGYFRQSRITDVVMQQAEIQYVTMTAVQSGIQDGKISQSQITFVLMLQTEIVGVEME